MSLPTEPTFPIHQVLGKSTDHLKTSFLPLFETNSYSKLSALIQGTKTYRRRES